MIRHSSTEREVGSWLPTETAQTRSCSWQLNPEKAKCPIPPRAPAAARTNAPPLASGQRGGAYVHPSRGTFPGGRPWQYSRAMRPWTPCRGNFFTLCIPKGASDGKGAPSWQHIAAMHPKRAGIGKIRTPCIRKALQIAAGGYSARTSCQEGALFVAQTPRIMHSTRILPSGVDEPPWHSQPLCRRTARAARNHGIALMARQPSERATRHSAKPPEHSQPRRRRTAPNRPQPLRRSATRKPTAWIGCTMLNGFARIARARRSRPEPKCRRFGKNEP